MENANRGVHVHGQDASESSPLINQERSNGEAFVSVSLQSSDDSHSQHHQPPQTTKSLCIFNTGKIAREMLLLVGLWNPRCGIRAVIPVIYALCSGVFTGFIVLLCYYQLPFDLESEQWLLFYFIVLLGFSFLQLVTYLVLLFSVCRQSRRANALTLSDAYNFVSKQDWRIINSQVAAFLLVVLSFYFVETNIVKAIPFFVVNWWPGYINEILMFPAVFWLLLGHGTGNWLFAIMTAALKQKVEHCLNQIKELETGTIEDVIDIHERLCEQVFETVASLKLWFIIHWFSNWVLCILTIVTIDQLASHKNDYKKFDKDKRLMYLSYRAATCGLVFFVWYSFITPCVYASRLTGSCRNIIDHLNKTKPSDWSEGHPLSCRATLSHFLAYIERRKCGFMIGQLTFDSRVSWLSFFLSFCGLAVKAFT